MLPRSKPLLALLIALPLVLVVWMLVLSQRRPRLVLQLGAPVQSLALSHDAHFLAIGRDDGRVMLWDTTQARPTSLFVDGDTRSNALTTSGPLTELRFSPDGQTLLASNVPSDANTTALYCWDVPSHKVKWSAVTNAKDDSSRIWSSVDGKLAAQRSYDVVKVLDISQGGAPQKSKISKSARIFPVIAKFRPGNTSSGGAKTIPQALALSPDSKTLVLAALDGHLEFWDAAKGEKQKQTHSSPSMQSGGVYAGTWQLQYSPDSRFVALYDNTHLCVWNIATGHWTTATIGSGTNRHASLAWMPDSKSLWTGSWVAQQWSVPNLELLHELPVSGPVAVSDDGRTLATRSQSSNGIWFWNIS